jgi:hypothetical protein
VPVPDAGGELLQYVEDTVIVPFTALFTAVTYATNPVTVVPEVRYIDAHCPTATPLDTGLVPLLGVKIVLPSQLPADV